MQFPISSCRRFAAGAIAVASFFTMGAGLSRASTLTFYTTRADFNAAQPGLPVEGFDNANIGSGAQALQSSPISSATNDSVFSTGSILPGLTISNSNAANTPGLIVYGDGAIFGSTKSVGTNYFGDALVLSFAPGVTAVAADVFAAVSLGQTLAGSFTEDVYDGSTLLGSTTFTEAQGAFGFIGVSSLTPITSVTLLYTTDDATTFADNIAFGSGTPAVSSSGVPEPASLSMFALSAGLFALCIPSIRSRAASIFSGARS